MHEKHIYEQYVGKTLRDQEGNKIGKITDIYLDDATKRPEWFAVSTGLFGTKVSFVPMVGALPGDDDDEIVASFMKDQVKDAPNCDEDGALTLEQERALYDHYGVSYTDSYGDSVLPKGVASELGDEHDARVAGDVAEVAVGHVSSDGDGGDGDGESGSEGEPEGERGSPVRLRRYFPRD